MTAAMAARFAAIASTTIPFHDAGLNCPFQFEADISDFNCMSPLCLHLELGELIHARVKASLA